MAGKQVDENARKAFNERLIKELARIEVMQKRSSEKVDEEINRFTAEYEQEKTRIDGAFRKTLDAAGEDEKAKELLWSQYRATIGALQARLIAEMRRESTTVLHDVAVFAAAEQGDQT